MMNRRQYRQAMKVMMISLVEGMMFLSAQTLASRNDADQIISLLAGLSNHSKIPANVLDPNLSPSDRDKNLHHFSAPHYELNLVPTEGIPAISGEFVSVPIRVHFNSGDGNSLDVSATAQFVKRNGTWYFSNFNFMTWPAFLIIVLIFGILVGIGYAVMVIILMRRLLKQGPFGIDGMLIFFPIFWPYLFRKYHGVGQVARSSAAMNHPEP